MSLAIVKAFPWQLTGFPDIDHLARDAESLFQWALDHGLAAPRDTGCLTAWAEYSVEHTLAADAVARGLPVLISAASKFDSDSNGGSPPNVTLPESAELAGQYLAIAARHMNKQEPTAAHTAIRHAVVMLNLAREAMDTQLRHKAQSKGGKGKTTKSKGKIINEAKDMLGRGLSKANAAKLLGKKHGVPANTIRDWLKDPR